jgi:potassium efflux system protein
VPGLLEISIPRQLPLDAGARYAVTTITRYVIIAVGVVLGFGTIGVGWSKVQWLIAALSVGLGFGLQEIFANFVSGLIILFERPIRVGDVVTIEDVSGVVTRIQTRATTVTNWDRKEFIVPNKEFITGRLLNWTRADKINRIVINVGIAYGSDTERACEILLKTVNEHPEVMADPEPRVTFEEFGDNCLKFVVRCYLPSLDNRLTTIHELHMAIDREFRKAGIEIPFPQRDVHIRSAAGLPQEPETGESGAPE